jgi:acetoin utilization protein AcuB
MMTRRPATVRVTTSIAQAMRLLQELDVRHLPVVNEDGELEGMISDRDLRGLPLADIDDAPQRVHVNAAVATIMSTDVLSVEEEAPLGDVVAMMLEAKVGAIPVVDADGRLVGIVSYVDLLRDLAARLARE